MDADCKTTVLIFGLGSLETSSGTMTANSRSHLASGFFNPLMLLRDSKVQERKYVIEPLSNFIELNIPLPRGIRILKGNLCSPCLNH